MSRIVTAHGHVTAHAAGSARVAWPLRALGDPVSSGTMPRTDPFDDLRPLSATRLADGVVEQIRGLIVREGFDEGARLPSERDLAARFGASRATISQALRILSLMGLVEVRRGSGAYVVRNPARMVAASVDLMLEVHQGSIDQLCELRLWLETLGASRALRIAGRDELDSIAASLARLRRSVGRTSEWIAADTVFHAGIVSAAGNPYLTALYESIHTSVMTVEFNRWIHSDDVPDWLLPDVADHQIDLHVPILHALQAHDTSDLERALLTHHATLVSHVKHRQ